MKALTLGLVLYRLTVETGMPHLEENLRYATVDETRCLTRADLATVFPILKHPALADCVLLLSVEGETRALPAPFFVIATQNPSDQLGTYPLPESQLDRFLMCITLGYPDRASERALLAGQDRREAIHALRAVMSPEELILAQRAVREVHASDTLLDYLQTLIAATRSGRWFVEGLSPRAGIAVLRVARARALLAQRDYVAPDDVQYVLPQAIAHRLVPVAGAGRGRIEQVRAMIEAVPLP